MPHNKQPLICMQRINELTGCTFPSSLSTVCDICEQLHRAALCCIVSAILPTKAKRAEHINLDQHLRNHVVQTKLLHASPFHMIVRTSLNLLQACGCSFHNDGQAHLE